jgi:hypothetical protein
LFAECVARRGAQGWDGGGGFCTTAALILGQGLWVDMGLHRGGGGCCMYRCAQLLASVSCRTSSHALQLNHGPV